MATRVAMWVVMLAFEMACGASAERWGSSSVPARAEERQIEATKFEAFLSPATKHATGERVVYFIPESDAGPPPAAIQFDDEYLKQ